MKNKLQDCIHSLEIAKDAISKPEQEADPEIAVKCLQDAAVIIAEFAKLEESNKKQYFDDLLKIQMLAKLVQSILAKNKSILQKKILINSKRSTAIKGYGRNN